MTDETETTESTDSERESEWRDLRVDEAFVCDDCGERWYYTRSRCPACGDDDVSTYALGEGELLAQTEVRITPPDVRSPNPLGLARFDGVQLIAQLADDVAVGDRLTFAGAAHLREGDRREQPRLTRLD